MTVVNSNIKALIANQARIVNERSLNSAMTRLSTGKRINSAADDAAGLAISNKMTAQIRSLNQAVRNANDAMSMIQTADSAAGGISDVLFRMKELVVQATNGTNSTSDKTALQTEFLSLQTEITRISDKTTWNGTYFVGASAGEFTFQIGADSGATMSISTIDLNAATGMATVVAAAATVADSTSLTKIDAAIEAVNDFRADMGAKINRLQYAADNLVNISTNTAASRSRILDTDYGAATSQLARAQIIQQAGTAMLAQANQQPAFVLSLLR
jgi:flagellin